MLMNEEQRAAYRDGLLVEKAGYEHRVAVANETGDDVAVKRYTNRIAQVDAEVTRVDAEESVETSGDDVDVDVAAKPKRASK